MNTIKVIDTDYLRADRSFETVLIKNEFKEKVLWVYNFEGTSFTIFDRLLDISCFMNDSYRPTKVFESEKDLDAHLLNLRL